MIIPIGHENSEVQRLPWVTFAIMAICTLVLVQTQHEEAALEGELVQITEELGGYVQQHPWLELDDRVADLLFSGYGEDERAELLESWAEGLEEPFEFEIEAQQRELTGLTERFLGVYDAHPFRQLGLVPAELGGGGWLTHQFVHGGWMHLVGNMFLLFLAGACIEDVWGRPLFAAFYLLSGVAGATLFAARYPDLTIPLVGASGAVSGVLGAFLVRYWSTRIKFFYWIGLFYRGTFLAPAWLVLPLWLANELLSAQLMDSLLPGSGGGGVAHWAHVGGFAFGVGGALAIRQLRVEERWIAPRLEGKTSYVRNTAVEQAAGLRASGNAQQAFDALSRELRAQPANYDAALALWDVARELGRARDAAAALGRVIRHDVQEGDALRALSRLEELDQHAPGAMVEPLVLLRLATALAHAGRAESAPLVLRRAVPDAAAPLPTAVAVRIANGARSLDPASAARAARIALGARDLDPRERPALEVIARGGDARTDASSAPAARPAALRAPEPIELPAESPIAHPPEEATPAAGSAEKPASSWSLEEEESTPFDFGRTIDLSVEEEPAAAAAAPVAPQPAERQTAAELSDASALDLSGEFDPAAPEAPELEAGDAPQASAADTGFDFQDASAIELPQGDETRVAHDDFARAPGAADDRTRAMPRASLSRAAAARPARERISSDEIDLSDDALAQLSADAERALGGEADEGGAGFLRPADPDGKKPRRE